MRRGSGLSRCCLSRRDGKTTGTALGIESELLGVDFVGVADRDGVAIPARQVPAASDLLATAEAAGRAGRVAECLASVAGRA